MGGLIPLGDASRRWRSFATVTLLIIVVNAYVFLLELSGGNHFVRMWSVVPIRIVHGSHLITLLTSMFLHASWMHIIGNMVFLWAFGPAMEDAMGHARFLFFYLFGGIVAMSAQVMRRSVLAHSLPGRQRRHRRRDGRVHRHLSARPHPHPGVVPHPDSRDVYPRSVSHRLLVPDAGFRLRRGGRSAKPAAWLTWRTSAVSCLARCWAGCL